VDDVVLGALERDPRQRYGSVGSFAAMFRSGVEGEVDVETGRPRLREEPARPRQVPVNEPAVAMKGSPRLASRRGEPSPSGESDVSVLEASFAPMIASEAPNARAPKRIELPNPDGLSRRLWQAVILAAILNVVLVSALLITRGEIPGVWSAGETIGPGATVRIAGVGLVAREQPSHEAPIVANLPEGGEVQISGERVHGDGGLWWPIEAETGEGRIRGFVPESWVQTP
jgi:hypothetical protein